MYSKGDKVVEGGVGKVADGPGGNTCPDQKVCATLHPSKFVGEYIALIQQVLLNMLNSFFLF